MLSKNNKTKTPVRDTEMTIAIVASALKARANAGLMRMAMMEEGISPQKADIIIRWAKRINASQT